MNTWGGRWTEKKLDCVSKYLQQYQNVMKNKNFELVYIDAFCGQGTVHLEEEDAAAGAEMPESLSRE